jgi:hypothetical protein
LSFLLMECTSSFSFGSTFRPTTWLASNRASILLFVLFISSVGTALGYGLEDRSSRVQFPAEAGNFSLHHRVQNGSGAHPASYSVGTRGSFLGGKVAEEWIWPLTI